MSKSDLSRIFVAIPLMNELDNIPILLDQLINQYLRPVIISFCINQPESWRKLPDKKEIILNNRKTLLYLNKVSASFPIPIIVLDHTSPGNGFHSNVGCVGLARKLCIDSFLSFTNSNDIIVNMDADTYYPDNYFENITDIYNQLPLLSGVCAPYYHKIDNLPEDKARLMLRYEIFLHYYTLQLLLIKSPYAYMPIGSAMSFRVEAYKKAGGFKVKDAGEDFYTMQQIRKIGIISSWLDSTIYPAARISDRVVFGTGPAISLNLENQIKKYPFYPTYLFKKIEFYYQILEHSNSTDNIIKNLKEIIPEEIILKIYKNHSQRDKFVHAIHEYFDAFHILKFLNAHYFVDIDNDFEYFKNFYQELFKKDIIYKNWQEISIDELNLIRDDLYNYELNLHRDKLNFLLMNKTDKKLWQNLKML
ncbi:MAG: hypothetical protein QMD02_06905 [Bacteroidales bacterium]|nr:hypothetical protein [Bacteroidales bacterium]